MAKTEKRKIGDIGEELAARFLKKRGYKIVERNYLKKWGEIDIVALRQTQGKYGQDNVLHFIEVKSLTWRHVSNLATGSPSEYNPEDAVRAWKKNRMKRAIRTYLLDRKISDDIEFQIDIMAVFLDFERKKARIRIIENVNL